MQRVGGVVAPPTASAASTPCLCDTAFPQDLRPEFPVAIGHFRPVVVTVPSPLAAVLRGGAGDGGACDEPHDLTVLGPGEIKVQVAELVEAIEAKGLGATVTAAT